jgi:putative hydrolase of the HAD superfamily
VIFEYFLQTYKLPPSECFFLDDVEANVEAARGAGMHAEVFESVAGIRPHLLPA